MPLRILVIGAHPDDCEIGAGGTTLLWLAAGHTVRFVSTTNGEAGHHELTPPELAARRKRETEAVSTLCGVEYEVMSNRDGRLLPTLEARFELIALIRRFRPDLILTHRPNDYHPDHRYTAQLVCDAAYMVTVPHIVPDVPYLTTNPIIAHLSDRFERPYPFSPRVAVDIEPVLDRVIDMMDCHESQFYEWLAYNLHLSTVPKDSAGRKAWLKSWFCDRIAPMADRYRNLLAETYGAERAASIRHIEAFEPCEYGSPLTPDDIRRLFPMLPAK